LEDNKGGANFYSDTGQPVLTMKSLYREKDALVMKGVLMGAWDSKIYIHPKELVKMLGMILKPSVIGYVLSLPFLLIRSKKAVNSRYEQD
jgi:hypothetical protein